MAASVAAWQSSRAAQLAPVLQAEASGDLSRWEAALRSAGGQASFVPVGELTGQIGDWEESVGGNNKMALMSGAVEATGLPGETPPNGQVKWDDGGTQSVALVSAKQAFDDIKADGLATGNDCSKCVPIEFVGAELTSVSLLTNRGTASTPAWEFTLKGTSVKVTRIAVASKVVAAPPTWDPYNAPEGLSIEWASGSASGRELQVGFVGAPDPATKPCGEDYTAEAVESAHAIVVIVVEHPNLTWLGACSLVGAERTAVAKLAAPLGTRAVLEVKQGQPVSVRLTN